MKLITASIITVVSYIMSAVAVGAWFGIALWAAKVTGGF